MRVGSSVMHGEGSQVGHVGEGSNPVKGAGIPVVAQVEQFQLGQPRNV